MYVYRVFCWVGILVIPKIGLVETNEKLTKPTSGITDLPTKLDTLYVYVIKICISKLILLFILNLN